MLCSGTLDRYLLSDLAQELVDPVYPTYTYTFSSAIKSHSKLRASSSYVLVTTNTRFVLEETSTGNSIYEIDNEWPFNYECDLDYPFLFSNAYRSDKLRVYDWSRSSSRRLSQEPTLPDNYNKVLVSRFGGNKDHVLVYHEDSDPRFF